MPGRGGGVVTWSLKGQPGLGGVISIQEIREQAEAQAIRNIKAIWVDIESCFPDPSFSGSGVYMGGNEESGDPGQQPDGTG